MLCGIKVTSSVRCAFIVFLRKKAVFHIVRRRDAPKSRYWRTAFLYNTVCVPHRGKQGNYTASSYLNRRLKRRLSPCVLGQAFWNGRVSKAKRSPILPEFQDVNAADIFETEHSNNELQEVSRGHISEFTQSRFLG